MLAQPMLVARRYCTQYAVLLQTTCHFCVKVRLTLEVLDPRLTRYGKFPRLSSSPEKDPDSVAYNGSGPTAQMLEKSHGVAATGSYTPTFPD